MIQLRVDTVEPLWGLDVSASGSLIANQIWPVKMVNTGMVNNGTRLFAKGYRRKLSVSIIIMFIMCRLVISLCIHSAVGRSEHETDRDPER